MNIIAYLLRPPISLERLGYDPQTGKVTIRPLAGQGRAPVELEQLEFIARVVLHIPDVRERQVNALSAAAADKVGRGMPGRGSDSAQT